MKFPAAVAISVVFHISLFIWAAFAPMSGGRSKGTTYYVDMINFSGGSGGGGNKMSAQSDAETQVGMIETGQMKDLTVQKDVQSKMRFPTKEGEKARARNPKKTKKTKKKEEKKSLVEVVRKKKLPAKQENQVQVSRRSSGAGSNEMKMGVSAGRGSGSGTGRGTGSGTGSGTGLGSPYGYYYDTLRSRVSASWFSSLVSPGLKGKFVSTVNFKIYRNGQVRDLRIEKESGIKSLDLSAMRAIQNASPFPQLPRDFPGRYLIVHFDFLWER